MLNHTTKPIVFVTYDFAGCVDAIAMAEAAAGGAEALAARPTVACYVNATSGLRHNEEALDKLLFLAGKRLPVIYVPGGSAGLTDPVTVAGSLATKHAGALVGVVLAQLKRTGAPIILPGWGSVAVDMRTLVRPYAAPSHRGAAEALVHYLNLPMFSLAGVSDAKLVDQQAGIEAALTLMVDVLAGGQLIHDLGYLESGLSASLAQLAICNEILGWLKHFTAEVDLSDEAFALDLVEEVGPDGQFLDTEHTRRHFREHWYPRLFERGTYDQWIAKGGLTLAERAAAQVTDLLTRHRPEPLPAAAAAAVHAVVVRAQTR
jgi:trimethylamine--corrinoid protein Co-methyltransferase